jgi:hypothetical protein
MGGLWMNLVGGSWAECILLANITISGGTHEEF